MTFEQKQEILLLAKKRCSHWWVDVLDCSTNFFRQPIDMDFEEIFKKFNQSAHFIFIHRDLPPENYLEIGFRTWEDEKDYFLWIILDPQHVPFFLEKYPMTAILALSLLMPVGEDLFELYRESEEFLISSSPAKIDFGKSETNRAFCNLIFQEKTSFLLKVNGINPGNWLGIRVFLNALPEEKLTIKSTHYVGTLKFYPSNRPQGGFFLVKDYKYLKNCDNLTVTIVGITPQGKELKPQKTEIYVEFLLRIKR